MSNGKRTIILWLAQGFGSGTLPKAPGTWGSVVGLILTCLLTLTGSLWVYFGVTLVAVLAAVPLCTQAGRLLGETDPAAVVADEIVAVPIAFSGCIGVWWWQTGAMPGWLTIAYWSPMLLLAFGLFRLFDIWKPGVIDRLQSLPDGWGVVADDVGAGVLTSVFVGLATWCLFLI